MRTKLWQGLGTVPNGIKDYAFRTFLLLYYNQVLGLPASQASFALLIALIFDAISDPVVGSYSDNLRHRMGRRHPLMMASVIPLGLSIFFLFAPQVAGEGALFWWLLVFSVATRVSLTFFNVPWNALYAEMSDDYTERSELISYRFAVIWVVGIAFSFSVFAFIFTASDDYPRGQLNPANYPLFAWTVSIVVVTGALLSTWFTRDQIPYLRHPLEDPGRFSFRTVATEAARAIANRDFRILFFAVLASSVVSGTNQALEIYMTTYFWGFSGEELRWMAISGTGGLIAFLTVIPLQARIDKKYLLVSCSIAIALVTAMPVTLRLLDLAPPPGSAGIIVLVVGAATFVAYFVTIAIIMFASMVADTLDVQELNTGLRQEGLFNSVITFSAKATSGAGLLITGFLIDFVVGLPQAAQLEHVTEDMVLRLAVMDAYVVPLFNLVWMWLALRYSITREQHEQVRARLDGRA